MHRQPCKISVDGSVILRVEGVHLDCNAMRDRVSNSSDEWKKRSHAIQSYHRVSGWVINYVVNRKAVGAKRFNVIEVER